VWRGKLEPGWSAAAPWADVPAPKRERNPGCSFSSL
jgi:hypothetical protein